MSEAHEIERQLRQLAQDTHDRAVVLLDQIRTSLDFAVLDDAASTSGHNHARRYGQQLDELLRRYGDERRRLVRQMDQSEADAARGLMRTTSDLEGPAIDAE